MVNRQAPAPPEQKQHVLELSMALPNILCAHDIELAFAAMLTTTIPWNCLKVSLRWFLTWLSEEARGDTARA